MFMKYSDRDAFGRLNKYRSAAEAGISYVAPVLSLHLNSDFTDSSNSEAVMETSNTPSISTDYPKQGIGSMLIESNEWIAPPLNDSRFYAGANNGNYTLEFWFRPSGIASNKYILFSRASLDTGDLLVYLGTNNRIGMRKWVSTEYFSPSNTLVVNTYHHIAIEQEYVDGVYKIRLYVDGTKVAEADLTINNDYQWTIGRSDGGSASADGYYDEITFTRKAKYKGNNFTP